MKHTVLALALLLATLPAAARESRVTGTHCDINSDWSVRMHRRAFVFAREDHQPGEVGFGGGRLFVDGKEVKLSSADQARVQQFEQEMTALVPELRHIVLEAVDIAFVTLTEVARGLASDPKEAIEDLQRAQAKLRAQMDAQPLVALDGDAVGRTIEPVVSEFVPQIIGGAMSGALKAAFGGQKKAEEFERRMEHMEKEIDGKVEARAKTLEPLAEGMCQRMKTLDRLDDELEYRLPDGGRLELLRVGPRDKD
jgi:hypothetical protein